MAHSTTKNVGSFPIYKISSYVLAFSNVMLVNHKSSPFLRIKPGFVCVFCKSFKRAESQSATFKELINIFTV